MTIVPFSHCHSTLCLLQASSSKIHRSLFLTGDLDAVRHPFFFQPTIHSLIPCLTYLESVVKTTSQGLLRASSALIAAINSILLLVVLVSPPQSSFSRSEEH